MFVDNAQVSIKAGNGGNGIVSFRRERYVAYGGPDGGDGGRGGNIVLLASRNQNTLANFRFQKELSAPDGKPGFSSNMHGRNGKDLIVMVPVGTVLLGQDGKTVLADMATDGQEVIIAKGGKGGFGNAHFTSSVRQAPKFAEKGEPGEEFAATLELKMIADVGLVGLPNAGKSTFLAALSNAKPEIADYPFTTLTPNLGIVPVNREDSLLVADIPGLIEGASEGKGLGDEFLRHVERTKVLIHLIDAWQDDIVGAYKTIQGELAAYKIDLSTKPQLVVLSKIDGLDQDIIDDQKATLQKHLGKKNPVYALSATSKTGTKEVLYAALTLVKAAREVEAEEQANTLPIIGITEDERAWHIEKVEDGFMVRGKKIERFATRVDENSDEGQRRLRDIMRKMGIAKELEKLNIETGDKIHIGIICSLEY